MASSAISCGGVKAPSVLSDTRCTTCAASAGPSSNIAAVANAARFRRHGPCLPKGPRHRHDPSRAAAAMAPPGAAKAPKPGPPKPGRQNRGRSRARRSRRSRRKIRHQTSLSFPFHESKWSINFLDTTGAINVNQLDGGQQLISSPHDLGGMRGGPARGFITPFAEVAWGTTPRPASWSDWWYVNGSSQHVDDGGDGHACCCDPRPGGPGGPSRHRRRAVRGGPYIFQDEFDGPAGSAPDPGKWTIQTWQDDVFPPVEGIYRDDRRNVFVDGHSNLVLCATQEMRRPTTAASCAATSAA